MNHVCMESKAVMCGVPGCDVWKCARCIADHYRDCPARIDRLFSLAYNKQHNQLLANSEENGEADVKNSRGKEKDIEYFPKSVSEPDRQNVPRVSRTSLQ